MEFLVAMLFIESITLVRKYEFSPIPSPPFPPPQGASPPLRLLLINRDVRAARHGGAVLARRLLLVLVLLKQDGCARRRSSGGELRQCRGGGRGGARNSLQRVLSCQKSTNSPAEKDTGASDMVLTCFRYHLG